MISTIKPKIGEKFPLKVVFAGDDINVISGNSREKEYLKERIHSWESKSKASRLEIMAEN